MNKQYVVMNCHGEDGGYEQESVHLKLDEAIRFRRRLFDGGYKYLYICKVLSQQEINEAETHLTTNASQNG